MTQASGPPGTTRPLPDGLTAGGRGDVWVPVRPRYVALDVDGTLVTSDEVPDADVLDAIVRLGRTGVQVGLATGRMAAAADAILATGVLSGPHVFHNGAVVTDLAGSDRIVNGLTDAEVTALLAFGHRSDDLAIEIYVGRSISRTAWTHAPTRTRACSELARRATSRASPIWRAAPR
jgi:hydroxymethylpyrimidine pyrophosphatase-like HAD family hydrolase